MSKQTQMANASLMEILRPLYLERLKNRRHNKMIKVITGIRRCGKSYLLFNLFHDFLLSDGIDGNHLIEVDLDSYESRDLRNPDALYNFVQSHIIDESMHYVFLDEIQLVPDFESVLNGLMRRRNLDIYVTGSNARFLSRDIITEFRGRGDEIRVHPLNFSEYLTAFDGSRQAALYQYMLYGGLPQIVERRTDEEKMAYLKSLLEETYMRDIRDRHEIRNNAEFDDLMNILASNIGCLTNPTKLANTFLSVKQTKISKDTIKTYIDHLEDAFLIDKATRYDIKGNRYMDTPYKYYYEDLGLRNARLGFRQVEYTHLMENLVYNELRTRALNVDVGVVNAKRTIDQRQQRIQLEVDFVCNTGSKRYYIQSAYRMPSEDKMEQEQASLLHINDSFKKIIIVGDEVPTMHNSAGITITNIYDFLLNDINSL